MAEAHAAVAFQFTVTNEGIDFDINHEALKAVFESGRRSWVKRFRRFQNGMVNTTYPASPASWLAVLTAVTALTLARVDPSMGMIEKLKNNFLPVEYLGATPAIYLSTAIYATLLWLVIIFSVRFILKRLLSYKGFMYEGRGKVSLKTKIWTVLLRCFATRKPRLFGYQNALPNLPLPPLKDTMRRYLLSVRGFLNDEEFERMELLVKDFEVGLGPRLQRYLRLKWWWSTNYVSDWWEEYVYLRGRAPIMVNSNYYGMDAIAMAPTFMQAARAANQTTGLLTFRREIERETLKPLIIQGMIPLCSYQYERLFNTTRIPGLETDKVVHLKDSKHVAVMSRGRFYKVVFQVNGKMLNPAELQKQYQLIIDDPVGPMDGEEHLAALTAGDRIPWALARQRFFMRGVNKVSLKAIETAAFMVVLDDEVQDYDTKPSPAQDEWNQNRKLDQFSHSLLAGTGHNRWFDKCFNLVIFKNGRLGVNAEHSIADAPVMAHLFEYAFGEDLSLGYTDEGACKGTVGATYASPTRLKWELSEELTSVIETSLDTAKKIADDLDFHLLVHNHFGKGKMKKCKVSPDGFIQMGMQLAYYRDAGKFNLTYEASMTRFFREGRTETVRPCTISSCDFVKSMEDASATKEERLAKFHKAVDAHVNGYRDAMCGKGIDRHLFCLYVVSKYLNEDSPFLQKVLSEPWRLSTSQTPHQQMNNLDLAKHPELISAGGGFGPVAKDGYGVSYIVAGENVIFYHVSSSRSSPNTDAWRFSKHIEQANIDILALFN
ncbi:carnitine O-palmitoyltransferase 1, liver isoform-like isoform X2 [Asterias rubens]|uniref:carnitine O-palmitoyltransferase 1, liver isoform-like isoform X2 n=1 Tax=Asterias rubens TaxID=7604 RepID=UPI0014551307|nr:carnitine O-palmitoyltransferase 1, liver isoform-like isoform X2 [Asterias rubens]